jgi:hypothetical protein
MRQWPSVTGEVGNNARARLIFVDAGRHVARLVQMEISFRDAEVAAKVSSLLGDFQPSVDD